MHLFTFTFINYVFLNNNEFVKKPTTNNFILKEGYYLVNGYIGGNNLKYVDELINKYEKVVKEKDDGLCSAFNSYKICYNNFVNFLEISRKHIINKNISINNAALEEAQRILPKSGYDQTNLYVVPTYGVFEENNVPSGKLNQPAPPINVVTPNGTAPVMPYGTVMFDVPST